MDIISIHLTNCQTGECIVNNVNKEYDLDVDTYTDKLHAMLDRFIEQVKRVRKDTWHDCYEISFRSYRDRKELELPF